MNVKQILKTSDTVVGLVRDSRKLLALPGRLAEEARQRQLVQRYLADHPVRKLQIGAGPTQMAGWLSTDVKPESESAVFLDASRVFPFADNTFDYIYSEHMIEHIPWVKGRFMLHECRRVLRPGGTLRTATPDLKTLLGLYQDGSNPAGEKYIKWITERFLGEVGICRPAFVINNAFRKWGHQFLYDGDLLERALQDAGFQNIRSCAYGTSDDPNLHGIESHGANIDNVEMATFETMVYEARSPAAA